jgi:acrylyl-CoA reductase (NADPH)
MTCWWQVYHSTLNRKDGLAIANKYPGAAAGPWWLVLICAGIMLESTHAAWKAGDVAQRLG